MEGACPVDFFGVRVVAVGGEVEGFVGEAGFGDVGGCW